MFNVKIACSLERRQSKRQYVISVSLKKCKNISMYYILLYPDDDDLEPNDLLRKKGIIQHHFSLILEQFD